MGNKRDKKQKPLIGLALLTAAMALFLLGTGMARAPEVALACEALPGTAVQAAVETEPEAQPLDPSQRALVQVLSRRFMIAPEATETIVSAAHRAADATGLDPLLVLAVISIESRFNPLAESSMGAKGLMQIIPRFHLAKLAEHGGEQAVLDPESNIEVGTRILQEYIHRTGTLEAGLQFYNGASWDESAQYAQKVMAERLRLEDRVRAVLRSASAGTASAGG
jgi:soluble lytic murein transglycosylase-like protein